MQKYLISLESQLERKRPSARRIHPISHKQRTGVTGGCLDPLRGSLKGADHPTEPSLTTLKQVPEHDMARHHVNWLPTASHSPQSSREMGKVLTLLLLSCLQESAVLGMQIAVPAYPPPTAAG